MRNVGIAGIVLVEVVGMFVIALVLAGILAETGNDDLIQPGPSEVARQFVNSVRAKRYEGAVKELAFDSALQFSKTDFLALALRARAGRREILQSRSVASGEFQGTLAVRLGDGSERIVEFPCVREGGAWKISSLAAFRKFLVE